MSLAGTLSTAFYTGGASNEAVPHRFHCALAGRGYMIDMARLSEFSRRGIPMQREQADASEAPGEQTLSTEDLWRRSQDDWSHGAGQSFLDRKDSDNARFRSSKGIDVWTRWQMSLLPATVNRRASANTNLHLEPVGSNLYATDGAGLVHTTDLVTFTTVTGGPATAATSMTSDGFNVWTAHGTDGVYATTRGAATTASYVTGTVSRVAHVKGRLMAGGSASIYNLTAAGALPAPLFTHPNTDFRWQGFAEGSTRIYAAGFSGDKSLIYRIGIKEDGTGLDAPIVAAQLPDGEIVRSIYGYLGYILIGTDLGVRFCAAEGDGSLTLGALIPTPFSVRCFEGQDRFVWFAMTNYDATSTGLGRLDLSTFTAPLTPAYASDLMATGQNTVQDVVTFRKKRVFTVNGVGIFEESTSKVASGTLDTGLITYGLPDLKTAVYLDVNVRQPVDTNRAYLSVNSGPFTLVGTRSSATVSPFVVGEKVGETFEVRHELVNADADVAAGPIITRFTLRSAPRPSQGEIFLVPILLHERVESLTGTWNYQPAEEFELLVDMRESKELVTFQIGQHSYTVQVDDALFQYSHLTSDGSAWNGTALLKLKSPAY